MKVTTSEKLEKVIITNGKLHIPTLIVGKIGVGKSEIVKGIYEKYFDKNNSVFVDIRASQMDRTDVRGLFKIQNDITKWCIPDEFYQACEKGGILFFDEINLAPEDVHGALYEIILDRKTNNRPLHKDLIIVAACNPTSEVETVTPLNKAILNRFSVVEYEPEVDTIIDYLKQKYGFNKVIAFLKQFKNFVIEEINQDDIHYASQFARPRGWERVLKIYNEFVNKNIDLETFEMLAYSFVGVNAAVSLMEYINSFDKVSFDDFIKMSLDEKIETIKKLDSVDKNNLIEQMAVYTASLITNNQTKKLNSVLEFINKMLDEKIEIEITCNWFRSVRSGVDSKKLINLLTTNKNFESVVQKIAEMDSILEKMFTQK